MKYLKKTKNRKMIQFKYSIKKFEFIGRKIFVKENIV